jgi:hypothetical protein
MGFTGCTQEEIMKSLNTVILSCLIALLTACTPMIYGVPQDRWDVMTENERIAAMEAYKERQIAYQQAAAERARIRAEQEATRQAQLDEEMRRREQQVDLIYLGRAGRFGDLLEVSLYDGVIRLNGKKRSYSPVSFMIADGEIKIVPIYYSKGRKADLYVLYEDRHLWFDTDPHGHNTRRAGHLVYNDEWAAGITYRGVNSHGSRDMRGVSIDIDVIPIRRGRGYGRHQPTIIVKEKIVQAPPQVIIKEKVVQKPSRVVIKEKVVQAPPEVIVQERVIEKPARPVKGDKKIKKEREEHAKRAKTIEKRVIKKAHVELSGGKALFGKKYRPFKPVKFWIAEGETLTVKLTSQNKKSRKLKEKEANEALLTVTLENGELFFDNDDDAYIRVVKNKSARIASRGTVKMSDVDVKVTVRK